MIRADFEQGKKSIDLDGQDGNAFVLIGYANTFAQQLQFSEEATDKIIAEMGNGTYENLVVTFDKYFGMVVDLHTEREHLLELSKSDNTLSVFMNGEE